MKSVTRFRTRSSFTGLLIFSLSLVACGGQGEDDSDSSGAAASEVNEKKWSPEPLECDEKHPVCLERKGKCPPSASKVVEEMASSFEGAKLTLDLALLVYEGGSATDASQWGFAEPFHTFFPAEPDASKVDGKIVWKPNYPSCSLSARKGTRPENLTAPKGTYPLRLSTLPADSYTKAPYDRGPLATCSDPLLHKIRFEVVDPAGKVELDLECHDVGGSTELPDRGKAGKITITRADGKKIKSR